MAKVESYVCDKCGKPAKPCISLWFAVGTYTDAAGDTDTHQVEIDLCPACSQVELVRLVNEKSYTDRLDWGRRVHPKYPHYPK